MDDNPTLGVEIELACGDTVHRYISVKHRRMYLHPGKAHVCDAHGPTTVTEVREVSGLPAADLISEKLSDAPWSGISESGVASG